MKLLKFSWVLIALWSCGAQGMDTQKVASDASSSVTVTQQFSINAMSEDVLTKIWMHGLNTNFKGKLHLFKQHTLVIQHIITPMLSIPRVCKLWDNLWRKNKEAIIDMSAS